MVVLESLDVAMLTAYYRQKYHLFLFKKASSCRSKGHALLVGSVALIRPKLLIVLSL
jgi:hypothetical protein